MNQRSSTSRCDRIISLIDECLAEVESTMRSIAGEGPSTPKPRSGVR